MWIGVRGHTHHRVPQTLNTALLHYREALAVNRAGGVLSASPTLPHGRGSDSLMPDSTYADCSSCAAWLSLL